MAFWSIPLIAPKHGRPPDVERGRQVYILISQSLLLACAILNFFVPGRNTQTKQEITNSV